MLNLKLAAAAIAMLVVGTGSAMAETPWQAYHPRRVEVNDRLAVQNYRINQEYRTGEISRARAIALHGEDHALRTEERIDARFDGGHITRGEQYALNHQENAVSRQIGR